MNKEESDRIWLKIQIFFLLGFLILLVYGKYSLNSVIFTAIFFSFYLGLIWKEARIRRNNFVTPRRMKKIKEWPRRDLG